MRNKNFNRLLHKIMRELYTESTPPLDWDALLASSEDVQKTFDFEQHYLSKERFDAIVDANLKRSRLSPYLKKLIRISVYLGPTPTSFKKED